MFIADSRREDLLAPIEARYAFHRDGHFAPLERKVSCCGTGSINMPSLWDGGRIWSSRIPHLGSFQIFLIQPDTNFHFFSLRQSKHEDSTNSNQCLVHI